ncbi:hypothetical protein ACLOJK_009219 [Asimina triloba]
MKKSQAEIRRIVGNEGCRVEEEALRRLEYLELVAKETLRLHPPAPLLIPRETTRHCRLNGYDVNVAPKTLIFVNAFGVGQDPESWENPGEFQRERFRNSSVCVDYKGNDFQLIPFGAGRRMCPGLNFGGACAGQPSLLLRLDVDDVDMSELPGITVHKRSRRAKTRTARTRWHGKTDELAED